MDFFHKKENVEQYVEMVAAYNPSFIVEKMRKYVPKHSRVLELGMGPGKDFDALLPYYDIMASDHSKFFVDAFNERHPLNKAIVLDAITVEIDEVFECIFSNKVLHHLTRQAFVKSLENQRKCLSENGFIFMTLWRGAYKEEFMHEKSIRFTYYLEDDIRNIVSRTFDIVALERYAEFEADDSLLVVLKTSV